MSAFLVICILLLVLYFLVPTSIGLKDTKSPEQTNKIFQTVFKEQMNQSKAMVNTDPNDAIKDTDSDTLWKEKMAEYETRSKNRNYMDPKFGSGRLWECDNSEDCFTALKIKDEDRHMYAYSCRNNLCMGGVGGEMENVGQIGQGGEVTEAYHP